MEKKKKKISDQRTKNLIFLADVIKVSIFKSDYFSHALFSARVFGLKRTLRNKSRRQYVVFECSLREKDVPWLYLRTTFFLLVLLFVLFRYRVRSRLFIFFSRSVFLSHSMIPTNSSGFSALKHKVHSLLSTFTAIIEEEHIRFMCID